jgi:hypothetical protein
MKTAIILLALAVGCLGQVKSGIDEHNVYRNVELRFSFTPPSGLRDVTSKAAAPGEKDPNTIDLLLFELSGPDSNDLAWRALAVQSYSRALVSTQDDFEAESKLSRTVIGTRAKESSPATRVSINGAEYALSSFERVHGAVTEYSHVYTTVIHGYLVAFAFTGNSLAQLDAMAESLKSLHIE